MAKAKTTRTRTTKKRPTEPGLEELYAAWDAFMPKDAKLSKLELAVVTPTGPLKCTLRFSYCCYIDTARFGYVGDTLREAVKSFIDGAEGFPPHPIAVFDPATLKVVKVAPGYVRAEVKDRLAAILGKAFPGVP